MVAECGLLPPPEWCDFVKARLESPRYEDNGEEYLPGHEGGFFFPQQERIFRSRAQVRAFSGGIRAGKSMVAGRVVASDMAWRAWQCRETGYWDMNNGEQWAIVGPTYEKARREFDHVAETFRQLGLVKGVDYKFNRRQGTAPWRIELLGTPCEFALSMKTATDPLSLAGVAYRGMVLAEGAQVPEEIYPLMLGRVSQKNGWLLLSGTFEKDIQPWYKRRLRESIDAQAAGEEERDMYVEVMPSWENRIAYRDGEESPILKRARAIMTRGRYNEMYGGMPSRSTRTAMPYASPEIHVAERWPGVGTGFKSDEPVHLWIDPGIRHAMAVVAVQFEGNCVWVIDIVWHKQRPMDQVVKECALKPWAENVEQVVMDHWGGISRPVYGGPTPQEKWRNLWDEHVGGYVPIHSEPLRVEDGYDIHDRMLLNSWGRTEETRALARAEFGDDIDPDADGPRIMFQRGCEAPMFGGVIDGEYYDGEYHKHQLKVAQDGTVTRNVPNPTDDDGVKAINYGASYTFGVTSVNWRDGDGGAPFTVADLRLR